MARKNKQENEELLRQSYMAVVQELGIDKTADANAQVHDIILAADALQDEICQAADAIKIDAYAEIKERWPELGIPKNVWLELVHLRRLQRHTSLSEDFIAKVAQSFEGAKNVTALRSTMLTAIKTNSVESVEVPTIDTEKKLEFSSTETLDTDFVELLNQSADTRHDIDARLWTKMRLYGNAFCYLTKEPYRTFKELLDLWHYRNGGWPKATTPPRIWGTIFRFIHQYDMLDKYGFDMAKSWCARLGLKTERTLMSPTAFTFNEQAARFGRYFMAKLKDDTQMNYPQYRFEPWHHIIGNTDGDVFFAYIWDTRVIAFSGKLSDLKITDLRTDYADNCEPLVFDDDMLTDTDYHNVMDLADHYIPMALLKHEEVIEQGRPGISTFEDEAAARKAKLMARFQDNPDAMAMISDDPLVKFEMQHKHPELGFDENYSVKWKDGDLCTNEHLGEGRVVGADQATGELIVHFTRADKDFKVWMWHLTKIEEQAQ